MPEDSSSSHSPHFHQASRDTPRDISNKTPSGPATHASRLAIECAKMQNSTVNGFCGAMTGVASGIVTCPLDVIKTRLQAQGSFRRTLSTSRAPSTALYNGLIGTARIIWQQDGLRGMYRGLGPMLLGYLPTWAVYMTVYDASKEYWHQRVGESCCVLAPLRFSTVNHLGR